MGRRHVTQPTSLRCFGMPFPDGPLDAELALHHTVVKLGRRPPHVIRVAQRARYAACGVVSRTIFHWWHRSRAASFHVGNLYVNPCSRSLPGTTRRLLRMSSVSVRIK